MRLVDCRSLFHGFLVLIFLTTSLGMHAQVWTRAQGFGGPGADAGASIKVSSNGTQYVTGYFSDSMTIDGKTLVSAGDTDIFLAKGVDWAVQIGGAAHDEGTDVAVDSVGNIYLTGWFTDSATFYSTSGNPTTVSGSGSTIFLAKYNSAGVLAWVQTGIDSFGGINRGHGLAVSESSVYLTGMSQGSTVFTSSNGNSTTVLGPDTWHELLVRYDPSGNVQWGEGNEATANSIPHKVAVDAAGSAYVVGWFEGQVTFHSMDGNDVTVTGLSQPIQTAPDYPDDAFVAKYDLNGNVKWVNDIGGYKAILNDVTVGSNGQISVTGFIGNIAGTSQQQETVVLSQPPGITINLGSGHLTSPYNRDVVVATYNASGVALGALRIGGPGNEEGGSLVSSGSNLYVSGMSEVTGDLFIMKLTGGVAQWTEQGGPISAQPETLPRIALTPRNNIAATGAFMGSAKFGSFTLTSNGDSDAFVSTLSVP